jgi:signal transduction histidine kinase
MGLAGMRERVESLGGEFAIRSQPGLGTRVFASLPLQIAQETYE